MELRLTDRHIMALNVLLVAVLAYFAALAVNDVLAMRRPEADAPTVRVPGKAANNAFANRSRQAYQAIVERDIFNLEAPPPPPVQIVVEDLHLTLVGVSQTTKGKPYAIISNSQGEQSVYRVGEMIPDSGKLLEVGKDRAIVEHNGKQVAIEIPSDDAGGADSGGGAGARTLTPSQASGQDEANHRRMRRRRFQ
jgi:type II secretory pathway component PulC